MGTTSSKVKESSQEKEIMENGDARLAFTGKKANGSKRISDHHFQKEKENSEVLRDNRPNIRRVPKAVQGEQIAAGWPSWLSAVAGEAINGWVPRRADTFEKLDKIGQGTYSNVYKARDMTNGKIIALKRVRFENLEPETVRFMAREILILRRLDHPNVIKLEGLVTSRMSCCLYLVFEYMEHDLTGITSRPGVRFTEPQVKCYMHQLLTGLEYCHSRGVLHRDIKCSNLLVDDHGKLKIADFGLSTFFDNHQNFALTSRVVTLWYRPPELLLGEIHYGVAVDLWSAGCVLGELYAGNPIMPGKTQVEQLHKIFRLCGSPSDDYWRKSKLPHAAVFKPQVPYKPCLAETFKDISPTAFSLLVTLLSLEPEHRGTAATALQSEFFRTEPLACDPSSLPKYPPSKESDARLQKANRIRVMGAPRRPEYGKRESKNLQAHPEPDGNAGLAGSMQAQLLEEHDHHIQKLAEESRPEKIRERFLEHVTAAQVYSGPQIVPSYNVDQLLEEHDRQIRESVQKLRHEKRRASKILVQEKQIKSHCVPSVRMFVSGTNVDDLLEEHDRQIQESTQRWRLEKKKAYNVKP